MHDESLVRTLYESQFDRIEYLNLNRNQNWAKDPNCALMLIQIIEQQQCLIQLHFRYNPITAKLTT